MELDLARRRECFQIAADIAGRESESAQTGDRDVCKILTDTLALLHHLASGVAMVVEVGS